MKIVSTILNVLQQISLFIVTAIYIAISFFDLLLASYNDLLKNLVFFILVIIIIVTSVSAICNVVNIIALRNKVLPYSIIVLSTSILAQLNSIVLLIIGYTVFDMFTEYYTMSAWFMSVLMFQLPIVFINLATVVIATLTIINLIRTKRRK